MKTELQIKLQDLRCNWSFDLYNNLLESVDDYLEISYTSDSIAFLKNIKKDIKNLKIDIESNF